jgi:peptidoglycan-associated lipoprotein
MHFALQSRARGPSFVRVVYPTGGSVMNGYRSVAVALISLASLTGACLGCGHDNPPPASPSAPAPTPTVTSAPKPQTAQKQDPAVNVAKDILDACNITIPDRAPKFDFDSFDLSSSEKEILDQVAKCLTTGPLKGKNVKLIGRADPRGEQEYNMELGENRAHSVKKYMGGLGVEANRMTLTSRGALDATGSDEEGWRKDRRVDIALAQP